MADQSCDARACRGEGGLQKKGASANRILCNRVSSPCLGLRRTGWRRDAMQCPMRHRRRCIPLMGYMAPTVIHAKRT